MGTGMIAETIIKSTSGPDERAVPREGDYLDSEGFLCCGKCGERKETQTKLCIGGETRVRRVRCVCRCEREKKAREEEKSRKAEMEARIKSLRKTSLMDSRFHSATFTSAKETEYNKKNLAICRRYTSMFNEMKEKRQGLLFWGDVGTGKSYCAACIANALMDRGIPVIMTSFVKAVDIFIGNGDIVDGFMDAISSTPLIIFDDLGAERSTEYAIEKVYHIIDSRYRSGLPMIVTTNMTMKEMLEDGDIRYGRIYDRIFEMCYPVQWTGPSWRKVQARGRFDQMGQLFGE